MEAVIVCLAVLGVWPSAEPPRPDLPEASPHSASIALDHREALVARGATLREEVGSCFRRWARATAAEAPDAARDYLRIYQLLSVDRSLAQSERDVLVQKTRGRLKALLPLLKRSNPESSAPPIAATTRSASEPSTVRWTGPETLAQFAPPNGWGFGQAFGPGAAGGLGAMIGPQAQVGATDAGSDLVDLIQKTIAPQSWNINGGPGAIYYWSPGRALVISANQEVHEQLGDLLDQLRRAGQ